MRGLPSDWGLQRGHAHGRRGSTVMLACLLLLALLCGSVLSDGLVSRVEAADAVADKENKDKNKDKDKDKDKEQNVEDKAVRVGDPASLLNSLEQRRLELDKRARWLDLREADLKRLEEKLAKRIASLEGLRNEIGASLDKEKVLDDANIARLAKILSSMKIKAAADGLKSMDRETAVLVLKVMKEKVAAKILSKMDSTQAVELANELGIPMAERQHN
ncbi:MAG: hypothetical protein HQL90_10175 [Magnetococcales bacterium]|nr:hypothetical protein [Magnetococcales bacterium]